MTPAPPPFPQLHGAGFRGFFTDDIHMRFGSVRLVFWGGGGMRDWMHIWCSLM